MSAYSGEIALGRQLMSQIIDPGQRRVRTASLRHLASLLTGLGFAKIADDQYGPSGGRQLFFKAGKIIVRVKTKGDEKGPRAGQPHLSVGLTDGKGLQWFNDLAKFNYRGELAAKSLTSADKFNPTDFQGNAQRFVVIMGGKYDGAGGDAWANRTHFPFPGNFVDDFA